MLTKLTRGNLSGPLALPASSGGIIAVHLLFSQDITIMSSKLAGRASDPFRLPPCMPDTGVYELCGTVGHHRSLTELGLLTPGIR